MLASGLAECSIISLAAGLAGAVDGLEPGVQPMAKSARNMAASATRRANGFEICMDGSPRLGCPMEIRVDCFDDGAMTVR